MFTLVLRWHAPRNISPINGTLVFCKSGLGDGVLADIPPVKGCIPYTIASVDSVVADAVEFVHDNVYALFEQNNMPEHFGELSELATSELLCLAISDVIEGTPLPFDLAIAPGAIALGHRCTLELVEGADE